MRGTTAARAALALLTAVAAASCDKPAPSPPAASAPAASASASVEPLWRYHGEAAFETTPAVADGVVYAGDANGVLHAVDVATGRLRWRCLAGRRLTAPPVAHAGTVYVGDLDGTLHAVDADSGQIRWSLPTGQTIWAGVHVVQGDVLTANEAGEVMRLDARGRPRWTWQGPNRFNAAPAIWKGLAIFAGCDARLHGVDLVEGAERLDVALPGPAGATPLLMGDTAVIGVAGGQVVAIDLESGQTLWTYDRAQADMVYAAPVHAGGRVIVGIGQEVHAIDADDARGAWVFPTEGNVEGTAVVGDGTVFVTSLGARLYALDAATGQVRWRFVAGAAMPGGAVLADGRVIVADRAGTIYCLGRGGTGF